MYKVVPQGKLAVRLSLQRLGLVDSIGCWWILIDINHRYQRYSKTIKSKYIKVYQSISSLRFLAGVDSCCHIKTTVERRLKYTCFQSPWESHMNFIIGRCLTCWTLHSLLSHSRTSSWESLSTSERSKSNGENSAALKIYFWNLMGMATMWRLNSWRERWTEL